MGVFERRDAGALMSPNLFSDRRLEQGLLGLPQSAVASGSCRVFALAFGALAPLLLSGSAGAAPGGLDQTFGAHGAVATVIGSRANATAVMLQPDGKIVVAGRSDTDKPRITLVRYRPDGSLDTTFGTNGIALGTPVDAFDAVRQTDGKIVAVGATSSGSPDAFELNRFNQNGSLDSGFGTGGEVTTPVGTSGEAFAVALQPDGKIVVAGRADAPTTPVFALARYNADGSLDSSFGSGGTVLANPGEASDLAVQPDGKIIVAGDSNNGLQSVFTLARFNGDDGSPDTDFGNGGTQTTALSGADVAGALALQPDGRILVAGRGFTNSRDIAELVRYDDHGSLDSSFGNGGVATTTNGQGNGINALTLRPDGKIVAAGSTLKGTQFYFTLYRYNANGSSDSGFGSNGIALGTAGNPLDLLLQPDGKAVAVGDGTSAYFALDRFLGSTLTLTRAGSGSGTVSSAPAGISCGPICSAAYENVPVTLTATPSVGSAFAGWSGGGCTGTASCHLQLSSDRAVSAIFTLITSRLTVTRTGGGTGTVVSSPVGIGCGSVCSFAFARGHSVTLMATPAADSVFSGWSGGGCSEPATCRVQVSSDQNVTATFALKRRLTVARVGTGRGTVVSSPTGISCGSVCIFGFAPGRSVTLTVRPAPGSRFMYWAGACSGTARCVVTMNANHSVRAIFGHMCIVPKVRGATLAAARKLIKRRFCSVGKIRRVFSSRVKKGHVIAQKPAPSRRLAPNAKLRLTVSKGAKRR
jgi:uncharacterized delta-60 repeat protein